MSSPTSRSRSLLLRSNAHSEYPGGVAHFPVPDDKAPWSVDWPEYAPPDYTAPKVLRGPKWADPDIRHETPTHPLHFNSLDGQVDRRSHCGDYVIVNGVPRNPIGRTGIAGRGLLGRWGPNHAVDPIVSRWKRDEGGEKVVRSGKPILEFVAIKRKDNDCWGLPGGMVEPGETISRTLKKEFGEEAMNSLEATEEEKKEIEKQVNEFFQTGTQIYAGYIEDPRNTDNVWMETVAVNFHDETGQTLNKFKLQAGDDAGAVEWTEANSSMGIYPSYIYLIEETVKLRGAAW